MTIKLQYVSIALAGLFIVGIGFIVDRTGGFAIRTDDITSAVTLSLSQPIVRGVPVRIRWEGQQKENIPVLMQLVSPTETVILGSGKLLTGSLRITVPCPLIADTGRMELLDASSQAILASSSVQILPPGPDCI